MSVRAITCPECGSLLVGDWETATCQKCGHVEKPTEVGHLLREGEVVRMRQGSTGDVLVAMTPEEEF